MEMEFSYSDFQNEEINYCRKYDCNITLDRTKYDEQSDMSQQQDEKIQDILDRLAQRTTYDYHKKVSRVQILAQDYARKVFPTYKFIQPDTLIDDWLSTVDFHSDRPTRDHSLHQTLTAYIVSKMLGQGDPDKGLELPNGKTLLAQCAKQLLQEPDMEYLRNHIRKTDPDFEPYRNGYDDVWASEVFYEAAFISALFHDMGYPWQYVNRLSNSITGATYKELSSAILNVKEAENILKDKLLLLPFYGYDESVASKPTRAQKKETQDMIKQGLLAKHGMPGAMGFMCLNNEIMYSPKKDLMKEASYKLIIDWAAIGIMMHDMPGVYRGSMERGKLEHSILRLNCKKDPLSCIVSLADILEEFERPKALFSHIDDKVQGEQVTVNYSFSCVGTNIEFDGGKMKVTYLYSSEGEASKMEDGRKKEVSEYLNSKDGYLDLNYWGITDGEGFTKKN